MPTRIARSPVPVAPATSSSGRSPIIIASPASTPTAPSPSARVGDKAALDDDRVRSGANRIATGRPPPWTVDNSGFRGLAALAGMSLPGA